MGENEPATTMTVAPAGVGRWMALTAALLGWLFDGLEMGLFPLAARPALKDLLGGAGGEAAVASWFAVATAAFLVGAATGGVLFGWLGDRLGRVRAMTLSVLTYALFSGLCGLAASPWQVAGLRFVSALGMGGEWSLGVALVMEVWPNRSRALLAGLIGAAANFGYLLVALIGLSLSALAKQLHAGLLATGLRVETVDWLTANSAWRVLLLLGAVPAVLTLFIRLFVPESAKWQHEHRSGATSHWLPRDLVGVLVGAAGAWAGICLWTVDLPTGVRLAGSLPCLLVVTAGYLYPMLRYLRRSDGGGPSTVGPTLRRMLLAAALSGVPLLSTWASIQWAPTWADQLTGGKVPEAKAYTQLWSALGAVAGSLAGALLGDALGRRLTYALLCLGALGATVWFYQGNTAFNAQFLATVCLAGALSAAFYGWLPLYLPELFRTSVRATGQGFGFNFGRILAAVGVLQVGNLMGLFPGGYPTACSLMAGIYLVGLCLIPFAPETRGRPLPE